MNRNKPIFCYPDFDLTIDLLTNVFNNFSAKAGGHRLHRKHILFNVSKTSEVFFLLHDNAVIRYTFKTFDPVFGFVKVSLVTLSSLSL